MKFIFMLLLLFVLTDPALAKPTNNTSECLQMYHSYMSEYGASKFIPDEKMLTFYGKCMPVGSTINPANKDTHHQKLLQFVNPDEKIITIKA